jgi:hypothetical protein
LLFCVVVSSHCFSPPLALAKEIGACSFCFIFWSFGVREASLSLSVLMLVSRFVGKMFCHACWTHYR